MNEDKNGILWIGSNSGLIRFDKRSTEFDLFTTKDGLINNQIYCVTVNDNYLWLSSDFGVSRFNITTHEVINFGEIDGLLSVGYGPSCSIGDRGTMYFGGSYGINYFKADDIELNSRPLRIHLTDIVIDGEQQNAKQHINLNYDNVVIQYNFQALDYYSHDQVSYAIKLENFDDNWRDIGNNNSTLYTNLDAGDYTFKVRATNRFGTTTQASLLTITKAINPLVSAYAIAIYILVILLLLGLYRQNLKQQVRTLTAFADKESTLHHELKMLSQHLQVVREKERAQLARELHDELAQVLVSMKLELHWILSSIEKDEKQKVVSRITEINKVCDTCIKSVRNIAQGLRPSILDDLGLLAAIENYLEEACSRIGIKHTFITDCETLELEKELEINLFRILQETIINTVRHAKAEHLAVIVNYDNKKLTFTFVDDGIGLKDTDLHKPGHFGLIGIRERVDGFDGTITYRKNKPFGLVVTLSLHI